ncbi:MAG: glycosyltransferase family 4 protein [Alphaproteobacteria bacterium]|nr:glycosyltransferase family 4 protein [Alphaproteobacteria bacterium]
MRIGWFVPAPFTTVSGGYNYDRAIVAGLRDAGHDVVVHELAGRHPLPDAAAQASAIAAWQASPPDALPVIDGIALPAFAPVAEQLGARGAIGLIHHPAALDPNYDAAARTALRAYETQLLPQLVRVVATSGGTAEQLATTFGVHRERLAVVMPGTADAPRSEGSGGPGCAILSVGALAPVKGHDVLLRALALLPDLRWRLTIAGSARDADYARSLAALAETLGIAAAVTFAGEVTDDVLAALWRRTDVFALATRFEGFGMAIAEALKRGVVVAITDGGAAASLLTPETGVVAPVDDAPALARALRRLIFDTSLRAGMRDAAFAAGRHLPDWPGQVRAFAAVLAG